MGWNSFTCFGITVREQEVLDNAKRLSEKLSHFGWQYVVLGSMWYEDTGAIAGEEPWPEEPFPLDEYGRLSPNLRKFPSAAGGAGLKPLSDAVHALGLKFGLHMMRGIPCRAVELNTPILGTNHRAADIADVSNICPWYTKMYGINMSHPAAQAYYDSVLRLYAEWGVDYLKADDCGRIPYQAAEIEGISRAVQNCGRPMVLSLSVGDENSTLHAGHRKKHCHLWRIGRDLHDEWPQVSQTFDTLARWMPHVEPGSWADPDMLPLGVLHIRRLTGQESEPHPTKLTPDEQMSLITLWCIGRAPLMFAGDLCQLDEWTLSLLTNREVLRVNQDSFGNGEIFRHHDLRAWAADSPMGRYVAFFNVGDSESVSLSVPLENLGAPPCRIRDLWAHSDLGFCNDALELQIPPHACRLFLLQNNLKS